MSDFFPSMDEISKKISTPYVSRSSTMFMIQKNNCYIKIRFEDNTMIIEGYVGGAGLVLHSKALNDFIARLRELFPLHRTAFSVHVDLEPLSSEFAESLYPIFPRIEYGVSIEEAKAKQHAYFVEDTYKVLMSISKIVDEFRAKDKSFESLKKLWKKALSSTDPNEKGKLLEEILSLLIAKDENFTVRERRVRTESEEIDIIVENTGMTQFYSQLRCPIILFECKNWSSKIGSNEIRDFAQKIQNRPRVLCSVGILVSTSKLTSGARNELVGYRGKDFVIGILEKEDMKTILDERLSMGGFLKNVIRKAGLR